MALMALMTVPKCLRNSKHFRTDEKKIYAVKLLFLIKISKNIQMTLRIFEKVKIYTMFHLKNWNLMCLNMHN